MQQHQQQQPSGNREESGFSSSPSKRVLKPSSVSLHPSFARLPGQVRDQPNSLCIDDDENSILRVPNQLMHNHHAVRLNGLLSNIAAFPDGFQQHVEKRRLLQGLVFPQAGASRLSDSYIQKQKQQHEHAHEQRKATNSMALPSAASPAYCREQARDQQDNPDQGQIASNSSHSHSNNNNNNINHRRRYTVQTLRPLSRNTSAGNMPPPSFLPGAVDASTHSLAASLPIPHSRNKLNEFRVTRVIGKGCFSVVYQANRHTNNQLVALKKISLDGMTSERARVKCLREIQLLQSLDHPNIIKYYDSFIQDTHLYIVLEWAGSGDLKQMLEQVRNKRARLHERVIWAYFSQICKALQHMHSRRMIHRDVKPANVFVLPNGLIKLGDLGLGRSLSESTIKAYSKVGTPLYMSPEVLQGAGQDFKSDIWSLGCVLYEMAMLRSPFEVNGTSLQHLFDNIVHCTYPEVAPIFSDQLRAVVRSMINVNADARPKIQDATATAMRAQDLALDISSQSSSNKSNNSISHRIESAREEAVDSARSIETLSSEVSQIDFDRQGSRNSEQKEQQCDSNADTENHSHAGRQRNGAPKFNINTRSSWSRRRSRGGHKGADTCGEGGEALKISARGKASKRINSESKLEVDENQTAGMTEKINRSCSEGSGLLDGEICESKTTGDGRETRPPLKRSCSGGAENGRHIGGESKYEPHYNCHVGVEVEVEVEAEDEEEAYSDEYSDDDDCDDENDDDDDDNIPASVVEAAERIISTKFKQ